MVYGKCHYGLPKGCCGRRAQGRCSEPHWTGRGGETPAFLPSILGGSKWRYFHRRQLELWELQAVRRNRLQEPLHCPRENSSWEQLHPKACKLHSGVTVPKWTVHAVLEERTFIPARVSLGLFYLTWCLNVHHRYCGSESLAVLTLTPSITAVLPCQLSAAAGFPPQRLLRCLCAFPCQRRVLAEGKGLCLSWLGKALGQERGAAASALLQHWQVTT